ncbi:gliding motility lipoprotein GldH [Apibacter raozihei]|uniref:gliding motility lipoprotein GldH n=1 Tax=Apibacter TaxID=1778601 RepID=UPI000FE4127D|nr:MULTISPECIES: gliding motility lipoprotein GldH [Apibacter]
MRTLVITFFFALLFIQCNHRYEYSEMVHINNSWNKNDTLQFDFTIKKPDEKKNINLVVRNNNDYPFSNLYLFLKLKQGNTVLRVDTLKYELADNTGKWKGTGVGTVKEIYLEYKKGLEFKNKGEYKLLIVQAMRKDTLKGIEDLGVNIE